MGTISKLLKPYRFLFILAPCFVLLETSLELVLPTIMVDLIEISVSNNDMENLISQSIIMCVYTVGALVSGLLGLFFASHVSQRVGTDLRKALFIKIQEFSFNNIDTFKAPSLITRLTNDITQVQALIMTGLRQMSRAPIMCIGSVIMSYKIHPSLAHILSGATVILSFIILFILVRSFPLFKDYQDGLDKVNGSMRESLSGVRVVKAFAREDYEAEKFDKVNDDYRSFGIEAYRLLAELFPMFMMMLNGSIVIILLFGGFEVNNDTLKSAEIMALIAYLMQMMNGLMLLGSGFSQISRAKISLDRINEVFEEEIDIYEKSDDEVIEEENGDIGKVVFDNVYFAYKDGVDNHQVLTSVTFTVKSGQSVGIIGETGSGKSTLLNLLVRLHDVRKGKILLNNKNIKEYKLEELHKKISIVFQDTILFTGTIKENIMWGKHNATDEEVIEACKLAQAHDFIMKFPDGYNTLLGQKGINLSGGQKQRISIARSLIRKSEVIIFDDSTSAVDSITESNITQAIANIHNSCTKFVIAQRISSVIHLDKIIILKNGAIVGEGNHESLLEKNEYYQEIYYSQKQMGGVVNE